MEPKMSNNPHIPIELLKKAAESALVSSFVKLNSTNISQSFPVMRKSSAKTHQEPSSSCSVEGSPKSHKVIIDLSGEKSSGGEQYSTSVFIKVHPNSSPRYNQALKELKLYEEFIKELESRCKSPVQFLPRCYLTQISEGNAILFLENLKASKFISLDPTTPLDFNHALIAVENLARFHSSSYFLKRQLDKGKGKGQGRLEMLRKFPQLKLSLPIQEGADDGQKMSDIYGHFYEQIICRLVEAENPSLAFKLRRKIQPGTIFEKITLILENEKYENDDFYVACHGDYRTANLMFKYGNGVDNTANKEPVDCRMVDLTSVRFAPIASDLSYFFLNSTIGRVRDEFEEKLLAFYCDSFEEHLTRRYGSVGQQIEDFDIEEFHRKLEDQYRRMLEFGFLNACVILPLIFGGYPLDFDILKGFHGNKAALDEIVDDSLSNAELQSRIVSIVKQLIRNRVL